MITQQDFQVKKEYYRDQMREAESYRIARRALGGRAHTPSHLVLVAQLGQRLIAWGSSLQERFGPIAAPPVRPSATQATD
jgi:hypothetical protein